MADIYRDIGVVGRYLLKKRTYMRGGKGGCREEKFGGPGPRVASLLILG